jgi:hypothetical protein
MDHDNAWDLDLPDIDIPDDGGDHEPPDPPRGRGGGGGGGGLPAGGDPFLHSTWTALVAVAVIAFFGLQSVVVVWLARSGLGDETTTLAMGGVFIVVFTIVFIAGARFIGRHRRPST